MEEMKNKLTQQEKLDNREQKMWAPDCNKRNQWWIPSQTCEQGLHIALFYACFVIAQMWNNTILFWIYKDLQIILPFFFHISIKSVSYYWADKNEQ